MFVKVNKRGSDISYLNENEVVKKTECGFFNRIHGSVPHSMPKNQNLSDYHYTVVTEHSVGDKLVVLEDNPDYSGLTKGDVVTLSCVDQYGYLEVEKEGGEPVYLEDSHVKAYTAETVKPVVEPQLEMFDTEPKKFIFTGTRGEFDEGSVVVEVHPDDTDNIKYFKGTKNGQEVTELLYNDEREPYTPKLNEPETEYKKGKQFKYIGDDAEAPYGAIVTLHEDVPASGIVEFFYEEEDSRRMYGCAYESGLEPIDFEKAFTAYAEPSTVKVDTNYQVNLNLTTEQLRDLRDCLDKFGRRINAEHPVANDVFMELKRHLTLIGSNS